MSQCPSCGRESRPGARFCDGCGTPFAVDRSVERRKLATLLFCDMVGSTALAERVDPETVHDIMFQYFTEMRSAIERHGGTLEKFIGDAVVAVFGVPTAHEDDALRAVRAASDMLERLDALNERLAQRYGTTIGLRIGVNSGEVVTGDPAPGASLVTGDAVNLAARLEQAAAAGEVLLGPSTYDLVRHTVTAEPGEPLNLKGKALPVTPFRLLQVERTGLERRQPWANLVGRADELEQLGSALEAAVASTGAVAALVVGEPGIGKSALAQAFLRDRAPESRAFVTQCLRYGEAAYWPLAQLIRAIGHITEGQDRSEARLRLAEILEGISDREAVLRPLEQVMGLIDGLASANEIAWATRRLLEAAAGGRPVVVIVDDIQWAEPPFLELLENVRERVSCALLLIMLARPELEAQPQRTVEIRLGALDDRQAADVVDELLGDTPLDDGEREQVLAAADGNPLFLGELVSYLRQGGSIASGVPASLEMLLSARLDALPPAERSTLEHASIEGEVFHRGAVSTLSSGGTASALAATLLSLEKSGFIRPTTATIAGEVAFRFHHLMVRDVAYRSAPKRRRALLHVRFADWLTDTVADQAGETSELVGFHLEQAWLLNAELGTPDDDTIEVGARAAELLAIAARRSLARGDARTAATLLPRAAAMAASARARAEITLACGIAMREVGDFAQSEVLLGELVAEASDEDWRDLGAHARVEFAMLKLFAPPYLSGEELREAGEGALATFAELGDDRGLALAYLLLAEERWNALHCAEMETLLEQAVVHAERSADDRLVSMAVSQLSRAVLFGPRPALEAALRCDQLLERARPLGPTVEANISMMLGALEAATGNSDRSERLAESSTKVLEELSTGPAVARSHMYAGFAGLVGCDWERAERELRASYVLLEELGERGIASSVVALLARALVETGQHEEAETLARLALEWAADDDVASQAYARAALARVLVDRGDHDEARRYALDTIALSADSDFVIQRADVHLDAALVLRACADDEQAAAAATGAIALYRAKGSTVALERASLLVLH